MKIYDISFEFDFKKIQGEIHTHTHTKKKKKGCTWLLIVAPPLYILKHVAEGVFNAAHYTRTIYHGFN